MGSKFFGNKNANRETNGKRQVKNSNKNSKKELYKLKSIIQRTREDNIKLKTKITTIDLYSYFTYTCNF